MKADQLVIKINQTKRKEEALERYQRSLISHSMTGITMCERDTSSMGGTCYKNQYQATKDRVRYFIQNVQQEQTDIVRVIKQALHDITQEKLTLQTQYMTAIYTEDKENR